ncbi:MAG: signal peptide peptidase SppA, partial [Thermoanaerobaculia bacterium]
TPPAAAAPPPAPTPPRRRSGWLLGFLGGCFVFFGLAVVVVVIAAIASGDSDRWSAGEKVGVLAIDGEIVESREIIDRLHDYRDNHAVKAIVVRIDSPGGAIAPSQEIFEEIRKVRSETGKPVIASIDNVGASGGYYIAAGCDSIMANPGSITGSIGVIAQWLNYGDLLQWAKLKPETITSGKLKDAGSPYRAISEDEKEYFRHIVSQLHEQFVNAVTEGRRGKLTREQVVALADGRAFTGEEARKLHLIDELGNLQDAIGLAAKKAGIKKHPGVIYPRRNEGGLLEMILGERLPGALQTLAGRHDAPFLYRW